MRMCASEMRQLKSPQGCCAHAALKVYACMIWPAPAMAGAVE